MVVAVARKRTRTGRAISSTRQWITRRLTITKTMAWCTNSSSRDSRESRTRASTSTRPQCPRVLHCPIISSRRPNCRGPANCVVACSRLGTSGRCTPKAIWRCFISRSPVRGTIDAVLVRGDPKDFAFKLDKLSFCC